MNTSLHRDERGIQQALLAVIIVVVLAAVGFVGWRVLHKSSDNGGSCMKTYNDRTLCNFAANNSHLSKFAYTATDTSTDNQGNTTKILIKNDGKGDYSVSSQNGNQSYNTVTIGNTIYAQNNGSSWIQYKAANGASPIANPISTFKATFTDDKTPKAKRVTYTQIDRGPCDNGVCVEYSVKNPNWAGTNNIWINTSTNRLYRWYNKNGNGVNNLTISYGPVTITAPSPVAPASSALSSQAQAEAQAQAAQH